MSLASTNQTSLIEDSISWYTFDSDGSSDQIFNWLSQQLNRVPESFDLFTMGKILYSKGDFRGSVKVLELYRRSGGSELPGLHLLGHAYYKHGDKQQALDVLRTLGNKGFDDDWQLVVELSCAAEEEKASLVAPFEE